MRNKKFMYEVFWIGEATFQGSSQYFQTFSFTQTMNHFWHLDRVHAL